MALIRFFTFRTDSKDLKDIRLSVTDSNQLSELIRLIRQVSVKEALEPEEIFKAIETVTKRDEVIARIEIEKSEARTKEELRRAVARCLIGALSVSFLLVYLHSKGRIQLPAGTLKVINESVIAEVVGLFGVLISYLFGRKKEGV